LAITDTDSIHHLEPIALGVDAWRHKASEPAMSRTTFYQQVKLGHIEIVKRGRSTLVTTPPKDYIAALRNMPEKAA
jgi:hypothetical protein